MARNPKRRRGRDFELLVEGIERAFAGSGARVRSPFRARDIHTGGEREIDVGIVQSVGTTEILIAIECRDRRNRQDVTWIEQLVTKCTSIGAARIIAVSRTPFSTEAMAKAAIYGVLLRRIDTLTAAELSDWLRDPTLIEVKTIWEHLAVLFEVDPEHVDPSGAATDSNAQVFETATGQSISLTEVVSDTINRNRFRLFGLPPKPTPVQEYKFTIEIPDGALYLRRNGQKVRVFRLFVSSRMGLEFSNRPLAVAARYSQDGSTIAEVATFPFGSPSKGTSIQLARDGLGKSLTISILSQSDGGSASVS